MADIALDGAVRFDEGQAVGVDRAPTVEPVEQFALALDRGQGNAVGATVRVDAGRQSDRANVVAPLDGHVQPGEHHRHHTLAADIAVGVGGERTA